jgi:hypothetical protein
MIIVPTTIIVLLLALHVAALGLAVYLFYPGLFTRIKLTRAAAPPAERWMLLEAPDGQIIAWRIGDDLPTDYTVSDPGPFTRSQLERMAQN